MTNVQAGRGGQIPPARVVQVVVAAPGKFTKRHKPDNDEQGARADQQKSSGPDAFQNILTHFRPTAPDALSKFSHSFYHSCHANSVPRPFRIGR